jgi:hypothetical protein
MPLLIARIAWVGPWIARWKGHDTDLFFIFCKYYYILSEGFMPSGLPLQEKAQCPGFVLVQAQVLSIIESTILRQGTGGGPPVIPTFDGITGPDVSADASALMALPTSNLHQKVSESRVIALLKDFLTDPSTHVVAAQRTFAASFALVFETVARSISQFNGPACSSLCDFLEEMIPTLNQYEAHNTSLGLVKWDFWIQVWKKMLESFNTMSEIRTLSFIFSIWETLAREPQRKRALCFDWLLSESFFATYFNHWCPMVRAYYHRLLCWRICRDEGQPSEVDT